MRLITEDKVLCSGLTTTNLRYLVSGRENRATAVKTERVPPPSDEGGGRSKRRGRREGERRRRLKERKEQGEE